MIEPFGYREGSHIDCDVCGRRHGKNYDCSDDVARRYMGYALIAFFILALLIQWR